ncbi:ABC transporter permease [Halobacillus litoralis]|uniref:ABC transporter permease n=1 Tax=Halobacillus litoralis TaxID=45668 RepID=UPI001CFF53CD|nr:ABC transporter permease [Halobacillus litoralis]
MKWIDRFQFIRQNMKKNKSRVWMTILATAIGCAFLIVLASIGFGAQRFIVQDMMQDRDITEISIYAKSEVEEGDTPEITKQDIELFKEMEDVRTVSHKIVIQNSPMVHFEGYEGQSNVSAVDFSSEKKSGLELSEGRMPQTENEVLVGYHLNQFLYPESADVSAELFNEEGVVKEEYRISQSLLNATVELEVEQLKDGQQVSERFPVTVVGIMEPPSRDWQKSDDVYISEDVLAKIEAFTGTENGSLITPEMSEKEVEMLRNQEEQRTFNDVKVIAENMEKVESLSQQLKDEGYQIYSVTEEVDQVNVVFAVIKVGLIIVGTIALLIASIGIYNTMSMAVTERTQDIGIMKAIGGHPRMIKSIFLMESGYIGLMGAVAGVVAAYLISTGINQILPFVIQRVFNETPDTVIQLSYIPPYMALICLALSVGVAMLSGMKPAAKATRIDVLRALRRDV